MIRDAILKTKRDELGYVLIILNDCKSFFYFMRKKQIAHRRPRNCIASRKRKLQELYHATVSYARPPPQKRKPDARDHHTYGEAEFLDVNNVLEYVMFHTFIFHGRMQTK